MKRTKALRQRKAELLASARGILDDPKGENGVLTAEQRTSLDKLKAEAGEVSGDIERYEAMEQEERTAEPVPDANVDAEEDARKAPQGFDSLGEMFQCVARAGDPDRKHVIDNRLVYLSNDGKIIPMKGGRFGAAATGMNERVGSEGGFLVEKTRSTEILKRVHDIGQIYSRVRTMPVGPNSNGFKGIKVDETSRANGSRWGGVRIYWTPEAGLKQASQPALAPWEIGLNKVTGLVYVTDEALEDAVQLEGLLREAFPEELTMAVEEAILFGTGAGQPLGMFNSGQAITVAAEGGQPADTVNYLNLVNMVARLDPRSVRNAVWLYNHALFAQFATLSYTPAGGTSIPVFMPANIGAGQPFATLFGIPMIPSELASAPGDLGDIALVDLSEYLLITKGGVKTDVSMHVRFIYDETAFRFVLRVGGAPKWDSPLTPKNGTLTVSPVVLLAAR
ncbi:MAG: phage major capsid protein [Gemmatimonadales bacterium]|nr:phage major capsid protein [Gemmatimonadales bacterium]